jgi:hypothetical protein
MLSSTAIDGLKTRSTSQRLHTVFGNSSGELKHISSESATSSHENMGSRFDKGSGFARSFALSASFLYKEADMRQIIFS